MKTRIAVRAMAFPMPNVPADIVFEVAVDFCHAAVAISLSSLFPALSPEFRGTLRVPNVAVVSTRSHTPFLAMHLKIRRNGKLGNTVEAVTGRKQNP
jgi:hypothetical protein